MRLKSAILNRSEGGVHKELLRIQEAYGFHVNPHIRLSDVVEKGSTFLTQRQFDYYAMSHFDFVLADESYAPILAIEYDGPSHKTEQQKERDAIKNEFCAEVGLPLLRIDDRYVSTLMYGMTLLQWIIETRFMEDSFYHQQGLGNIPLDEQFDPFFMTPSDSPKLFPYWISRNHIDNINQFLFSGNNDGSRGWMSICSESEGEVENRMSFLEFDDQIIFTKTSMRRINLDIASPVLHEEIANCELGLHLENFQHAKVSASTKGNFVPMLRDYCEQNNATPTHQSGNFSFRMSWNDELGWSFGAF